MMNRYVRYAPILYYINKNRFLNICEVGSGSKGLGEFSRKKFVGCDINFKDYGKNKRVAPSMKPVRCNAKNIPLKNDTFDLVFSLDLIEHIKKEDRKEVIGEMYRISKNFLIIGFPIGQNAKKVDKEIFDYYKKKKKKIPQWLKEHLAINYPSYKEIARCLKEYNYEEYYNISNNMNFAIMKFEANFLGMIISIILSRLFRCFNLSLLSKKKRDCYRRYYIIKKC